MEDLSTVKQAASIADSAIAEEAIDAGLGYAANKLQAPSASGAESEQKIQELKIKYDAERDRRLRPEGLAQYIDVYASEKFRHFQDDPFAASEPHAARPKIARDGDTCKYLVMGAGMGGLCAAVRLRMNGVKADDILIVDSAGGFGGTWYWNRYPGLACDCEGYLYLPFLEETGYIPKHKYSYGPEIRGYMNLLADKYDLRRNAIFQADVSSTKWDEHQKHWITSFKQKNSDGQVNVKSKFTIFASGVLHSPKIPNVVGLEDFKGHMFHTSRWDYSVTGGTEVQPDMEKLRDKNVAIVGTGATAIQAVAQLAKWAKKLYVVQRTPCAVGWRGQQATDPETFRREVATHPGWQHDRHLNFSRWMCNYPNLPQENLVDDDWTRMPSAQAFVGGQGPPGGHEQIPELIARLHALDLPHQERIRQRIDEVVKSPTTAEKLKPWYPGWCKRPTFSDLYLQSFNQPNVELIDTDGKGLEKLTKSGIVVGEREIPTDLIILATGYRFPGLSPAARANIEITGRGGLSLDDKYNSSNWGTLHGLLSRDFPNLFLLQVSQFGVTVNYSGVINRMASHMIHILNQSSQISQTDVENLILEPTPDGEEAWANEIAKRAKGLAAMSGCTPGYYNAEGATDKLSLEQRISGARKAIWGEGWPSFIKVLDAWEAEGSLQGVQIGQ